MKIADLFVNLGVKGDGPAQKALTGVRGTLGEISASGLAAKAAVIGVLYGLQRLMTTSGQAGASLMSYAGATGLSAETLQRWQYAARQANVSAEEMEGSITGLQSAMINMQMGNGVPNGMGIIANSVDIDQSRVRDTMYMMGKLAEYAQKEKNVDFANEQLKSFGLSLAMISAMRRNAFSDSVLKRAPHYSNSEAEQLQKVNVAWGNLGSKIEMAMGHLNAKHGPQLIRDISDLTDSLLKLSDTLLTIGERFKIFEIAHEVFKGLNATLHMFDDTDTQGKPDLIMDTYNGVKAAFSGVGNMMGKLHTGAPAPLFVPKGQYAPAAGKSVVHHHKTTINATLNGVKDSKDAAHHLKKQFTKAAVQLNSPGQTN